MLAYVRNEFGILGCHKRDDTTQNSLGKAKFISADGCATDKESGKKAHWAGSLLRFYS
jgi:hypothetical protein